MTTNQPEVTPGIYRHYKGGTCTVLNLTRLATSPEQVFVHYRVSDGTHWIRTLNDFADYDLDDAGRLVRKFERLEDIDKTDLTASRDSMMPLLWEETNRQGLSLEALPVPVLFQKLHPAALVPAHGQAGDAGADFYALGNHRIPARGRQKIPTGIAVAIPAGHYGHMQSRSGLSLRAGIEVGAGTIDSGYRGEISILLYNHGDQEYYVQNGDRIAQMVIDTFRRQKYEEVAVLPSSERTSGWGSSGV